MDFVSIIEWTVKSALLLITLVVASAYGTLYERKALAKLQVRIGPNRVGPGGWLQPIADVLKLILKEELVPAKADKLMFLLAPVITVVPALVILGVIPWGETVSIFGRPVPLSLANLNVGVLYITSVASIAVYGIVLAGWASNNKYAMMGGIRSTAQMISYELSLGLSFIGPILLAGSMSILDIVRSQMEMGWFLLYQPIGLIIFWTATIAEINRSPFDMPEAEQELTAGYHVEYSGMKFALFFMAEYIKMWAVSAILASLFLGGFHGPFVSQLPWLGPIYLVAKVMILYFILVWVRATLPRIRYDKLMAFGWKIMLPLALANVFITALGILLADALQNALWLWSIPLLSIASFALLVALTEPRIYRR